MLSPASKFGLAKGGWPLSRLYFFWPNLAVKGIFCPNTLFSLGVSSVVSGLGYHHLWAKGPLLLS